MNKPESMILVLIANHSCLGIHLKRNFRCKEGRHTLNHVFSLHPIVSPDIDYTLCEEDEETRLLRDLGFSSVIRRRDD